MGDWGWVLFASVLTYGGLAGYWWSLQRRSEAARRRLEDLR